MKKLSFTLAIIGASVLFFVSCRSTVEDNAQQNGISETVSKGKWAVNLYMDANLNQTNDFAGYEFVFGNDGKVTATSNGITTEGTWSENVYTNRILLNFNSNNAILNKITDEWLISSQNSRSFQFNNANQNQLEVLGLSQQ